MHWSWPFAAAPHGWMVPSMVPPTLSAPLVLYSLLTSKTTFPSPAMKMSCPSFDVAVLSTKVLPMTLSSPFPATETAPPLRARFLSKTHQRISALPPNVTETAPPMTVPPLASVRTMSLRVKWSPLLTTKMLWLFLPEIELRFAASPLISSVPSSSIVSLVVHERPSLNLPLVFFWTQSSEDVCHHS